MGIYSLKSLKIIWNDIITCFNENSAFNWIKGFGYHHNTYILALNIAIQVWFSCRYNDIINIANCNELELFNVIINLKSRDCYLKVHVLKKI